MPFCLRDDGLSEVVGFVLILAVIVIALSLYQVYGVPAAGREAEIAHMNHVKDRFVDYKIALDSLWINKMNGVSLSTAFDLGTRPGATGGRTFTLPILTPVGSGGTISVEEGGSLTIKPDSGEGVVIPLGSLSYRSSNNYWVDQTWIYQGGAIFLAQGEKATVRVGPSIVVTTGTGSNIDLNIALTSLEGSGMASGSGPVRIETWMHQDPVPPFSSTSSQVVLTVEGDEMTARAWERAFDEVRGKAKRDYSIQLPAPILSADNKRVTFTVPQKNDDMVVLTVKQAKYRVTIYNAASLAE